MPNRDEPASWVKKVTVSYHEAFKEELDQIHKCVVDRKIPVTGLANSRADLALIQTMARAWRP